MTTPPPESPADDHKEHLSDRFNHLSIWHFSAAMTLLVGVGALASANTGNLPLAEVLLIVFVALALVTLVLRIVGI